MLSGQVYRAHDPELEQERKRARLLIHQYNHLPPGEITQQEQIVRELFGSCGEQFVIEAPFRCDYGYNIHLGENFYSNFNLVILDCAEVRIGNNALIGPDVVIGSGSVVTRDIPSGVIAMGNPCRVLREVTEEDHKYYYKNLKFNEG